MHDPSQNKTVFASAFENDNVPQPVQYSSPLYATGQAPPGQVIPAQPFAGQIPPGQAIPNQQFAGQAANNGIPAGQLTVMEYIRTKDGRRKIQEMILCLGGFISSMIPFNLFIGGGATFVRATTAGTFVGVVIMLAYNTCLAHRRSPKFLLEATIFYLIYTLLLLGGGIYTAYVTYQLFHIRIFLMFFGLSYQVDSLLACSILVIIAAFVFAYDTYNYRTQYNASRVNQHPQNADTPV